MKKILLLASLLTGAFAVLGGIDAIHGERGVNDTTVSNDSTPTNYAAKYKDCIGQGDFPESYVPDAGTDNDWDMKKVDNSLAKYKISMETVTKNLNYIDAHNFIHQEFLRSKDYLQNRELSEIQKHYHEEVMRICYDTDKALNLGSASRL
ncbi:hypothetical protein [Flagellimonas amoyensis]|uniref:hypothetical protein n=1 Tax=Flagellimonas amoyensis TaxID=2169401 RepID=UPI000D3915F8|nr:hypothetical protein [Allomuricauda amoyensis]